MNRLQFNMIFYDFEKRILLYRSQKSKKKTKYSKTAENETSKLKLKIFAVFENCLYFKIQFTFENVKIDEARNYSLEFYNYCLLKCACSNVLINVSSLQMNNSE